jgi:hypothetical protein
MFVSGIFLLTFVLLGQRMADLNKEKQSQSIEEILDRVYDEVSLAQTVENGYLRKFRVPKQVMGEDYTMSVDEIGWMIIYYNNATYQKAMPQPMAGGFCLKANSVNYYNLTVSKEADLVSLSSCTDCGYSYAVCMNADKNGWCDWLSDPGMFPGFNETCCNDHCKCC